MSEAMDCEFSQAQFKASQTEGPARASVPSKDGSGMRLGQLRSVSARWRARLLGRTKASIKPQSPSVGTHLMAPLAVLSPGPRLAGSPTKGREMESGIGECECLWPTWRCIPAFEHDGLSRAREMAKIGAFLGVPKAPFLGASNTAPDRKPLICQALRPWGLDGWWRRTGRHFSLGRHKRVASCEVGHIGPGARGDRHLSPVGCARP
jgi:hypothetical protein